MVGTLVGAKVWINEGSNVGIVDGLLVVGVYDGVADGSNDGTLDGTNEGM